MRAVEVVFAVVWAAFWLYWLVAAFSMKRGRVPWSRELGIRAVIVVLVILLFRFGAFQRHASNTHLWLAGVGLVLFAAGLGFAIWARVHIGRNWGTPMTQKDEPELVTSGPYHLVRHPIYSGILVAGVGTAVALSWLWLIAVALAGVYFVYSAKVEEHYLTEQFPDAYPVYKRSTKDARAAHPLTGSARSGPARTASERRHAGHAILISARGRRAWWPRPDRSNGPPPADEQIRHRRRRSPEPWLSPGGMPVPGR